MGSVRDRAWGHALHGLLGVVWLGGALVEHVPDLLATTHRTGLASKAFGLAVILWSRIVAASGRRPPAGARRASVDEPG